MVAALDHCRSAKAGARVTSPTAGDVLDMGNGTAVGKRGGACGVRCAVCSVQCAACYAKGYANVDLRTGKCTSRGGRAMRLRAGRTILQPRAIGSELELPGEGGGPA